MRLFISYARVDKPFCKQIIELLDVHDVWHDQRLHIGQKWWDEIVHRLNWCDGVIYLLSPDSVASDYCRRELDLAMLNNKQIFPVLIRQHTDVPDTISPIQYADFSNGIDVPAVKTLLSAIMLAERRVNQAKADTTKQPDPPAGGSPTTTQPAATQPTQAPTTELPKVDGSVLLDEAVAAFRKCDYDKAVRLLKEVLESEYRSRFIDVPTMLRQAEAGLKERAYRLEAEREYGPIAVLMKDDVTRALGCTAFQKFQLTFPDYDPDNLKQIYDKAVLTQPPFDLRSAMPLLEWCKIPKGKVTTERNRTKKTTEVEEFFMSKYPVTNAQFQAFISASDGYQNSAWWQSSLESRRWHADHPKSIESAVGRENYPRTYICWYEASAFCQWLSYKTGWTIKLPTEQQWQRSARGDSNWRYPWGAKMDPLMCNTKESELHGSTLVTQYPKSASPYGVCDLLGNVWEWCSNGHASGEITDVTVDIQRVVRGGSFMSPRKRTNVFFSYFLNPLYRYQSIGFRIACETNGEFINI